MEITGAIQGIQYQVMIIQKMRTSKLNTFDINDAPSSCIVQDDVNEIAISKWVSPKRTRSYPYARVYDTIKKNKRATVIPVIKDEGIDGDRDFLQWDTISLMSLLEVPIIFSYYDSAIKNTSYENKVTNLKFNQDWVKIKIYELSNYQSSALHWNLKEIREIFSQVVDLQIQGYTKINAETGVEFHSEAGFKRFQKNLTNNLEDFMKSSRERAKQAQSSEIATVHIGERLDSLTKSAITITNYLGGKYFFTVDEVSLENKNLKLIESKHTKSSLIPSKGDIKDGLLKMILYSNLSSVSILEQGEVQAKPILRLTSPYIKETIDSNHQDRLDDWLKIHEAKKSMKTFITELFNEARINNFLIELKYQD
ncbi:hypothetical protein [Spirulina sp. 06S082]|uniref:hypothetical protein n=1 Tax=Spirulina sp. 06S082 TaxID=3110248 RepID=UPI002B1ECEFF|nr:hypothetical protein [Spirulina sp. 06S082]MEA5469281.1 hypothetical protein [Spirulina sp. 06S082]